MMHNMISQSFSETLVDKIRCKSLLFLGQVKLQCVHFVVINEVDTEMILGHRITQY